MALQKDQVIGQYRIVEALGAGGMAAVYKAYHARLDRFVAVKVMHANFQDDPNFHARFEREAQIVARLEHPNIVPVYDFNDHEKQPYLVMKYVEGRTLKTLLTGTPLPMSEIVRVMTPVADALTYAHGRGVLHRDIKPSNVMLDAGGTPYLTDFGLARIVRSGASTMSADVMIGTPQYISPEQAMGQKDLTAATDVYSFGIMLYEMVCGRVPFSGDTPYATVHDHIYSPPPPPSQVNPTVPPALEAVLLKALAKRPEDRYESANVVMQAFRAALVNAAPPAQPDARRDAPRAGLAPAVNPASGMPPIAPPIAPPRAPAPPQADDESGLRIEFPMPPLGGTRDDWKRFGDDMRALGERMRAAYGDDSHAAREVERRIERAARRIESRIERRTNRDNWVGEEGEGWDEDDERELQLELATDEEGIRKRAAKRLEERRGFIGHVTAYAITIPILWFFALMNLGSEGMGLLLMPVITMLAWGAGVSAHALDMYFKTGQRLEQRALDVRAAVDAAGGAPDEAQYERIRRIVYIRHKKRRGFFGHAAVYACINVMLWAIFFLTGMAAEGALAWPAFVLVGWGAGLFAHGASVLGNPERRRLSQEDAIRREIEMERERLNGEFSAVKRKNEDVTPPPVRLTADGELTDSTLDALEDEQAKRRRGGY